MRTTDNEGRCSDQLARSVCGSMTRQRLTDRGKGDLKNAGRVSGRGRTCQLTAPNDNCGDESLVQEGYLHTLYVT